MNHSCAKIIGLVMVLICFIQESRAQVWKAECVGRMQLRLPGETDVAGYSARRLSSEIQVRGGQQQFQFDDGQEAGWSTLAYTGILYVSNPITPEEYNSIYAEVFRQKNINQLASKEKPIDRVRFDYQEMDIGSRTGTAWHVAEFHTAFLKFQNHVLFWDVGGGIDKENRNAAVAKSILSGLSYRSPNQIPSGAGICLPYSFIKDDGAKHRKISTTFRLKNHPDVTIAFEDAGGWDAVRKDGYSPSLARSIHEFWEQYRNTPDVKSIESVWETSVTRPAKISGGTAQESFVKIIRPNGNKDYAYLALARDISSANDNTSKQRLLVIRESFRAANVGIEPIAEQEFIKMAQQITSSIKLRP